LGYILRDEGQNGQAQAPPNERRDRVFNVRITSHELKAIKSAAKRDGLDPRDWGRKTLISAAK